MRKIVLFGVVTLGLLAVGLTMGHPASYDQEAAKGGGTRAKATALAMVFPPDPC